MNSHSNFFSRAGWVWLIAFAAWVSPTVRAADHQVLMTDSLEFNPSYLEIEVGDTVTWYNADDIDDHTSTSTAGLWNSGDVAPGEYYGPRLFDTPGTFNYRDIYYSNPAGTSGMIGTIVVKPPASVAPAVLTAPCAS
jgi:plastocyanin